MAGSIKIRAKTVHSQGAALGFTLIEILVVIAIIALLIAILVPTLTAARNEAQTAVCGSNLKQLATGVQLHLVEQGMRRERISTNFGWATPAFRAAKEARGIFTCPSDPRPLPMPPLFAEIFDGGTYHGRSSSDGVFNKIQELGSNRWTLDIQDTVDEKGFGRDSGGSDQDLVFIYNATKGATSTEVKVDHIESSWNFKVLNHKGQTLWGDPRGSGGAGASVPLLWMSYGANAAAGLKNTKGNPLLLIENSKPGVFPESYAGRGVYGGGQPNDILKQKLRFRHGPRLSKLGFADPTTDKTYIPRQQANGAFLDGHVERILYHRLIGDGDQVDGTGNLRWRRDIWLGIRRAAEGWFD